MIILQVNVTKIHPLVMIKLCATCEQNVSSHQLKSNYDIETFKTLCLARYSKRQGEYDSTFLTT